MKQGNFLVKIYISSDIEIALNTEDVIELSIIEDIHLACMVGSITFLDKVGWMEKFKCNGQYPLAIMFKEGDETPVEKLFIVIASSPSTSVSQLENCRQVTWGLVEAYYSKMFIEKNKWSKTWSNKKGSEIITDVCSQVGITEFKQFEETRETFETYNTSFNTPVEIINWIKKRCSGSYSELGGYLFYSNSKGYNFVTYPYLFLKNKPEKDLQGNDIKYVFHQVSNETNVILDWNQSDPEQLSKQFINGVKVSYYEKGRYKEFTYKFSDMLKSNKYGPAFLGFSGETKSSLVTDASSYNTNIKIPDETNTERIKNMIFSGFIEEYLNQLKVEIIVQGSSTRYAGMGINIEWRSTDAKTDTDKGLKGLWLVKSVEHKFSPFKMPIYSQRIVCLKPGYGDERNK